MESPVGDVTRVVFEHSGFDVPQSWGEQALRGDRLSCGRTWFAAGRLSRSTRERGPRVGMLTATVTVPDETGSPSSRRRACASGPGACGD
jgi:hypothetical protein